MHCRLTKLNNRGGTGKDGCHSCCHSGVSAVGKRTRPAGFTLIELMVTVSVIGVLIAFGLPSLQSVLLNQRIKTTASDFHTALLLARSEAIKRGSDVSIEGNSNGWDIKTGTTVLQTKDDLDASITVECNTDADTAAETCPASITFKRTGRLDPANIPFEIRFFISGNASVFTRCVSISLSGRPRVLIDSDNNSANGC